MDRPTHPRTQDKGCRLKALRSYVKESHWLTLECLLEGRGLLELSPGMRYLQMPFLHSICLAAAAHPRIELTLPPAPTKSSRQACSSLVPPPGPALCPVGVLGLPCDNSKAGRCMKSTLGVPLEHLALVARGAGVSVDCNWREFLAGYHPQGMAQTAD